MSFLYFRIDLLLVLTNLPNSALYPGPIHKYWISNVSTHQTNDEGWQLLALHISRYSHHFLSLDTNHIKKYIKLFYITLLYQQILYNVLNTYCFFSEPSISLPRISSEAITATARICLAWQRFTSSRIKLLRGTITMPICLPFGYICT